MQMTLNRFTKSFPTVAIPRHRDNPGVGIKLSCGAGKGSFSPCIFTYFSMIKDDVIKTY